MKSTDFCPCTGLNRLLHPDQHDQTCTPCIKKNLRLQEAPSRFFNLADPVHKRTDNHFETFAQAVLMS